jgi:hypothetical protein
MELLLNLLWALVAALAIGAVALERCGSRPSIHASHRNALLAVACAVVLLFPIVSASDDLHSVQALSEDAIKRVQPSVAQLQQIKAARDASFLFLLTAILLLFVPLSLEWHHCSPPKVWLQHRRTLLLDGRAPPLHV